MGKTRDLLKKIRDIKGTLHAKTGLIKDRNGKEWQQKRLRGGGRRTRKCCARNVSVTWGTTTVWSLTWRQTAWPVKPSGP